MADPASRTALLGSWLSAWQTRPALRWVTFAIVLGAYAIASLSPFDWHIPRQVANHAERTPEGWQFDAPGIALAPPPHDWLEAARRTETLELSLNVRPGAVAQSGPARILTISRDAYIRNLTLGQEGSDLVLRLRTEDTDINGTVAGQPFARIPEVFHPQRWTTIDLEIVPGQLTLAVDGRTALAVELPSRVVETWDPAFSLALGNEPTCNRPWLGEIRRAVIRAPGYERDYVRDGDLQAPASCWAMAHPPALVPFRLFLPEDAFSNVLMYIPLGVLVGLMLAGRGRYALLRGLPLIAAVSVTFELTQLLIESRFPSIDDVVCNTIGGGLGLAFALVLTRSAGRRA